MATQINIVRSIAGLVRDIEQLLNDMQFSLYLKKIDGHKSEFVKINDFSDFSEHIDPYYAGFYLTSLPFDPEKDKSFFDDLYCVHVIEGLGGRKTENELENISLRIVSKTPDRKIKSFFNALSKQLKNDDGYGIGVGPGSSSFYKNTVYKKDEVRNRTIWFDFKRKVQLIIIDLVE